MLIDRQSVLAYIALCFNKDVITLLLGIGTFNTNYVDTYKKTALN